MLLKWKTKRKLVEKALSRGRERRKRRIGGGERKIMMEGKRKKK